MSKHHHKPCPNDKREIADRITRHCYDLNYEREGIIDKLARHCYDLDCDREQTLGAHFTREEARDIAKCLCVNIDGPCFDLEQFWMGLNVELEHGLRYPSTNITNNDPLLTGKIALAHLNQFPDYYTRLARMRKEAREYWRKVRRSI